MKKVWMRAVAFLLTLCMMLPMMQSVVFAVGTQGNEQDPTQSASYDFTTVTDINGTSLPSGESPVTKALYDSNQLNWTYISRDSNQSNVMVGGTSANGQTVRNWNGLRLNSKKANGWSAIKIKSAVSGVYQIKFNYQTYNNYAEVDVYILPGTTTNIGSALTSDAKIGAVNSYSNVSAYRDASVIFDNTYTFASGEEYIVVFHYPNPDNANLYSILTGMELIPYTGTPGETTAPETTAPVTTVPPEETTAPETTVAPTVPQVPGQRSEVVYDFDLGATELKLNGETFATKSLATPSISAIADYYNRYLLDWKYKGISADLSVAANFGGQFGSRNYLWKGLRLYTKDAENAEYKEPFYAAFEIRSPGTGKYYLTLDYQLHRYGAAKGSVYVLPADTTDITAAIGAGNALGGVCYDNFTADGSAAAEDASKTFEVPVDCVLDESYIVVFTAEETGNANFNRLFLNKITLTHEDLMPEPEPEPQAPGQRDEVVYDFDLGSTNLALNDGTFATAALVNATANVIKNYYESYALDWKYMGISDGVSLAANFGGQLGDRNYLWNGLRLYAKDSANAEYKDTFYTYFAIRSPGTGKYYLTFDYQTHRYGAGKGSVYVLPADTADIAAAIAAGNALGSVNYDNGASNGATAAENEVKTFAVPVDCVLNEEYILVFTSEENGFAGYNRLFVNKVTLTHEDLIPAPEPEPQAPGQRDEVIYDFDLGSTDLTVGGESFAAKSLVSAQIAAINRYYDETYILDWKYNGIPADMTGASIFGGKTAKRDYKWNGIRVNAKKGDAYAASYYVSFTIRSPGTGKYYLTFDYQTHRYGSSSGSIYILPGDTEDVAAAIAAGEAITTVNYDNRSADGSAAAVSKSTIVRTPIDFTLGEEYLLVFTSEKAGKAGSAQLYLDQVKLTHEAVMPPLPEEPKPPQFDQVVYDFALENTSLVVDGASFKAQNLGNAKPAAAVDAYYQDGKLNWNLYDRTKGSSLLAVFGGKTEKANYQWKGLRIYMKNKETGNLRDYYVAFTIQSPGTGNYKMTVDYMVARYGAKAGSIYVLPGDTEDVSAAIANGKAVGTLNFDNGASSGSVPAEAGRTTFSGNIAFEAGKEYIVVFRSHTVGRVDSYMYFTKLTLTKSGLKTPADIIPERVPEPEPLPEGSVIYDLDIADGVTGIMKGKGDLPFLDTIDDVDALYKKGALNWTYASHYCLSDRSAKFKSGGMVFYSYEMEWVAVKIKSPGEGLHTIFLNHAVSGNGAIGAVYILPADTQNVEAAMDPSNRVGKMSFANEDGTTAMVDGKRSIVGTWEFGDAEEYIVVFEAYEHSPFVTNRGYMYISQFVAAPGDHTKNDAANRKVSSIVIEDGPVKICESTLYGTTATINGSAYLFVPIEGKKLLAYNLSDGILEKEIKIPFTVTRGMLTDKDGNLWMVGDKPYIFRYDPVTGAGEQFASFKTTDLAPGASSGFDLVEDAEGYLYFGTYNTGAIIKFDPSTGKYSRLCIPNEDAVYPVGMAVKDGYLYSGVYGDKNADGKRVAEAVKVDIKTGEIVARVDLDAVSDVGITMYRGAGFAGDWFLLGSDGVQKKPIAIDINTMELVESQIQGGILFGVTEELNGKVYFVVNGKGLNEMDVVTHEVKQVPGLESVNFGIRCGKDNFVDIGDPTYPGVSIATYATAEAMPRIYNLQSGNVRVWSDLLSPNYGNPTTIRPIVSGLPGSNELYIGAYNADLCSVFNTQEGKLTHTFETNGQTDAMVWYDDVLYVGTYNTASMLRINFDNQDRNVVMMSLKSEYKQSRIHTMTAGDGKVFVGSTPDRYEYGGCLAWVDVNTLERHIERNVVQDQTINSLVYHDGYIYGTTSTAGGSGTAERPDLSAKLFVYDVENKKKVAEADLADYIPGLKTPIDWIYGIAADPKVDENGRFWGLVSETLFSFSFDEETGKLSVKEEVSYGKQTYTTESGKNWFPRPFVFDEEGYLYIAFEGNGGMRKINTNNVKDNTRVMNITPMFYALGEDGNIYYVQDQSLMMYPLNVTEEDWKIAEEMDATLKQLDPNVTLESEQVIGEIRTAYDALSWKHKALVQNVEILEFAEIDLLECKIDAIDEITIDSKDFVFGLMEQYNSLPERYQRYVKNADRLKELYLAMNEILDKVEADRVQKMIDAIKNMGEITLEKEKDIRDIRAAYEVLTTMQKSYVDTALLLDAEAKIKALRQVRIDRLIELIAKISEPVTLADEAVITEAMEIYQWMYMDERDQVDYEKLTAANSALTKLQKAAAAEVDVLIENGEYRAARKAYNALTEGSKQYVQYYDYLLEMEAQTRLITIIVIVAVVVAGGGVTTFFVLRKRKKSKIQ